MDVRAVVVRVAASAVGVVLAVSLAGCSGDEEPKAGPTSEPTGTSSPPETVSTPPADETAEEFIRRWNEALNAAQSGQGAEFERLSAECARCQESVAMLADIYRDGGYVKTDGRQVLEVSRDNSDKGDPVFILTTDSAPTEFRKTATGEVERLDGGRGELLVRLRHNGSAWILVDMWQRPR